MGATHVAVNFGNLVKYIAHVEPIELIGQLLDLVGLIFSIVLAGSSLKGDPLARHLGGDHLSRNAILGTLTQLTQIWVAKKLKPFTPISTDAAVGPLDNLRCGVIHRHKRRALGQHTWRRLIRRKDIDLRLAVELLGSLEPGFCQHVVGDTREHQARLGWGNDSLSDGFGGFLHPPHSACHQLLDGFAFHAVLFPDRILFLSLIISRYASSSRSITTPNIPRDIAICFLSSLGITVKSITLYSPKDSAISSGE